MIIYKFSLNNKGIAREEIEVIEKDKVFYEIHGKSKSVYKKSNLDIPVYIYGKPEMISLYANPEKFINEVIRFKKEKIDKLERDLAKEKNDIIAMKIKYEGIIESKKVDGFYHPVGNIIFSNFDKNRIHGERTPYIGEKIKIHTIIDNSEDILSYVKTPNPNIFIVNIFMDGRNTNLAIDGFGYNGEKCIISIEKFKELVKKTKIEINIKE